MRKIPKAVYQSPDDLLAVISARKAEADRLPPGLPKQSILIEISKLQAYADMKRWVAQPPAHKNGAGQR